MARTVRDPAAPARIGDAAARVVAEHGVRGATVRAIAAEAGVSTGSVTHYFDDKDAVIAAALAATNRSARARVERAADGPGPALDRLRTVVEGLLPVDAARRREWQVWVAVWGEAAKGDPLSEGFRAAWATLRDIVVALLSEAQEAGELPPSTDVAHGADRLVTLLAGLGLLAGVERPSRLRALGERMFADEMAALGVDAPS